MKKSAKKTIYYKKRTLEELLTDLDDCVVYLSKKIHVPSNTKDDIQQLLKIHIIETYRKDRKFYSTRKLGYWFIRCKWLVFGWRRKEYEKNPISRSVPIDYFNNICESEEKRHDN